MGASDMPQGGIATDVDRILSALGELTKTVKENRTLLNELVERLNEVEAEVQLVRQEVKNQASDIRTLESSLQFLTVRRRGKLTPLPEVAVCGEKSDAP
jgi:chromosome segregation ATPase